MRVATKRWGEITIKKQGKGKNKFDKTKSFSIEESRYNYTIEELKEIFQIIINLTEKYPFNDLNKSLNIMAEKEE